LELARRDVQFLGKISSGGDGGSGLRRCKFQAKCNGVMRILWSVHPCIASKRRQNLPGALTPSGVSASRSGWVGYSYIGPKRCVDELTVHDSSCLPQFIHSACTPSCHNSALSNCIDYLKGAPQRPHCCGGVVIDRKFEVELVC